MKVKQLMAVVSSVALLAGCLAGCGDKGNDAAPSGGASGGSETSDSVDAGDGGTEAGGEGAAAQGDLSEHVELSIGGINLANSDGKVWPTEVIKQVEEKFNVTIIMKSYDKESLNLDLSGGTTCDIVQINDENIEGVLRGKHAVSLEDYKDIAPNIFADTMQLRNDVMKQFKSAGEGKQYFVTPRVTVEGAVMDYGADLFGGYVLRWDLYKEIGHPEIKNDDDYIAALKAMKEIYPQTEDGLPVYAMSAYNDSGLHTYFFKGCVTEGFVNLEGGLYVQDVETNELVADIYDAANPDVVTPFWSGVQFFNKLYREGLLDPDCFITKSEDLNDKYAKGQYLGGTVNWNCGNFNKNQKSADPETLKQFVVLPCKMGWANEGNYAGWSGKYFYVSSHSENVERAVMVLDYLQSEEFSRIADSGVEGRWEIGEDGKPHLTADTIDMKTNPDRAKEWEESGIDNSNTTACVGVATNNMAADGGMINLWREPDVLALGLSYAEKDMCETLGLTVPSDLLKNGIEAGTNIDMRGVNATIRMCLETTPKDILRIDSNCEEIAINAIPSLVQANSDEEFAAAKAKLLEDLKNANAETSVEWWQNAWETSKSAVEQLGK